MNISKGTRNITVIGMLSAVAFILEYLEFAVPFMPTFIKMDLSELPALIGAFALGPMAGTIICLVKNILHILTSQSGGVGELSNFMLGAIFVLTAGMFYKVKRDRKSAIIGAVVGALAMGILSIVTNYFIVYPMYSNFMPMEAIIAAYQAINPSADTLLKCLVMFNLPFTVIKGLINVVITFLIYKKISPILKGTEKF